MALIALPSSPYAFEDLAIGVSAGLLRTVMQDDIDAFARVSGDENPIHLCDAFAARTPFGERIAHGAFTASLISAVLGTRLPGPGAVYIAQTLRFLGPVRIGDVIFARVEVIDLQPSRRRARLFCECSVDAKTVLEGEAILKIPSRSEAQKYALSYGH
jgi:3-hydroxybutyryl-CoA dehydratase